MLQVDASTVEATPDQVYAGGGRAEREATKKPTKACTGECGDESCTCEREQDLAVLDEATCPHKFGHLSKSVLLEHPMLIGKVISRAQRFSAHPGGRTLLEMLRGVRHLQIERMSRDERERTLRRALRRSGATLEPVLT